MAKKPTPPQADTPKIDPVMRAIGARMQNARKAAGYSGEAIARLLGYVDEAGVGQRKTVSQWETGRALPPANTFRQMCGYYGCGADELLWGDEDGTERAGQMGTQFRALLAKVPAQRRAEVEQTLMAVLRSIMPNGDGNDAESSKQRRAA
jgi:transcriptional regulator with XRE-family HTH domain